MAERRAEEIGVIRNALAVANRRLVELGDTPVSEDIASPSDDLAGDLFSARLLIQNLRRQLRERPPAKKVA